MPRRSIWPLPFSRRARGPHAWAALAGLIALLVAGCGGPTALAPAPRPAEAEAATAGLPVSTLPRLGGNLTVFAAASLTDAFTEVGKQLERANPGSRVLFNFAGSPTLRTQLAQGARADVFATADEINMRGAQQDGSIAGVPQIFARNRLVVIVPIRNAARITSMQDLARSGIKLVLADHTVPVGNYARESLTRMSQDPAFGTDFARRVLANVVSNETNVKQVVAKVQLGEADAGIVYVSDITAAVRPAVTVIDIPDAYNVIARYPVAVVKDAPNPSGAQAFIDYLLSPAGQAVLARYGFVAASAAGPATPESPHG